MPESGFVEPLDLDAMRVLHARRWSHYFKEAGACRTCHTEWPCDASRLLSEVQRQREENEAALKLVRDWDGWSNLVIEAAERLESERDQVREELEQLRARAESAERQRDALRGWIEEFARRADAAVRSQLRSTNDG